MPLAPVPTDPWRDASELVSLKKLERWGYSRLQCREELRDRLLQGQPALSDEQKQQAVPLFVASRQLRSQQAVQQ